MPINRAKKDVEQAKIEYEAGLPTLRIADRCGMNRTTIERRAKREGWVRDKTKQLILDDARIRIELAGMSDNEIDFHNNEVRKMSKNVVYIEKVTNKNLRAMMKKMDESTTIKEHKEIQETINKGGEALGVIGATAKKEEVTTTTTKTIEDFYGNS